MESVTKFLDGVAQPTVGAHYIIAFIVLVVLLLTVIILSGVIGGTKQGFNPTATMRRIGQDQQGVGWTSSENRERMAGGIPPEDERDFEVWKAAKKALQGASYVDNKAAQEAEWKALKARAALSPTSQAVLNSKDFDCDNRKSSGDDAWSWMTNTLAEKREMAKGGRLSDDALSAVAAGHSLTKGQ